MLGIWPAHKDVGVAAPSPALVEAISDRAINTLLLPQVTPVPVDYDDVHLASLLRCLHTTYLYDPSGDIKAANVAVTCPAQPLDEWVTTVAATVDDEQNGHGAPPWDPGWGTTVTQTLHRLSLQESLPYLRAGYDADHR